MFCSCFGESSSSKTQSRKTTQKNVPQQNSRSSKDEHNCSTDTEVISQPRPAKKSPNYILHQNTLSSYLDVLFFTPETGGQDISDEDVYLPDVTKNLVVVIPWLSPHDTVLMEYCMLYLDYETDVMVVRYGIHDLLNMHKMREMSKDLGVHLKKHCPCYSAVVCHSIQGGTFIMCDLLSRSLLLNISGIIVERLACDWINLPLDGLVKHSNSIVKRLSFRQEHEQSLDLREALLNEETEPSVPLEDEYLSGGRPSLAGGSGPYFETTSTTLPKTLCYSSNTYQRSPNSSVTNPNENYYQKSLPNETLNRQRPVTTNRELNPNDVHYRHSMATNLAPNNYQQRYRQNGNLRYHNSAYTPSVALPNHYNYKQNNNYYNNGAILPPNAHYQYNNPDPVLNNHKTQSFTWAPNVNGNGTIPRQPIRNEQVNISNNPYEVNSNYDNRSIYTTPGNYYGPGSDYYGTNNYYGTISSRCSIPANYNGHSAPGFSQGQVFRQHTQSFIEHSTTTMMSFSTIIPQMRVPVLIFATGKDNCDVNGIKSMIQNWEFQGVKVTLRYWKKCSGVSLLESHNSAFTKTLDNFMHLHNLTSR